MTDDADPIEARPDTANRTSTPSIRLTASALAGLAAAWLAADSTGLLAVPFRHALTWMALCVATIGCWPRQPQPLGEKLRLAAGLIVALGMSVSAGPVYNLLAVVLVLAMLARADSGLDGRVLRMAAFAVLVLGIYLVASTTIPSVWLPADSLGRMLGGFSEAIWGKPLEVGATFGGLDFLVLMAALYAGWLISTPRPRLRRALLAAAAVLGGHLVYLAILSCSADMYAALPPPPPPPEFRDYIPPPWSWSDAVRALLPWNLPLLAGVIHLSVAGMMFRWSAWSPISEDDAERDESPQAEIVVVRSANKTKEDKSGKGLRLVGWSKRAVKWGPLVLAVLLPLITTLAPGRSDLSGNRVVAYNRGYLDWEKPTHGSYGEASAGLYGMLPQFVASLGGEFSTSEDLAQEDLQEANVLIVIHTLEPWPEERLKRVREFVRGGGSLLVLAETHIRDGDLASSHNDVLAATGMEVNFDTAVSETGNWRHSLTATSHPAVTGIGDRRNRFGIVLGPSIDVSWPARPILVGRWGWSDPGSDSVLTGVYGLDAGERLGDLVLAAEQRLGRGTVVVLSDTTSFSNQGNVNSYVFSGRLLSYLAGRASNPQATWRQILGILASGALLWLIVRRPNPTTMALVAVALGVSLGGSRMLSHWSMQVSPDGRDHPVCNNVAYIDASHVEDFSDSRWGYDGVAGLQLTLMRGGYMPFMLPELTSRRLDRAGMLISIAPARAFSATERRAVKKFVENGGIFICMTGAEQAGPVLPLLRDFNLRVPLTPVKPSSKAQEPKPMGNFRTTYLDDNKDAQVVFHAGWPVECPSEPWERELLELLVYDPGLLVAAWKEIRPTKLASEEYRRIYEASCRISSQETPTVERLWEEFDDLRMRELISELDEAGSAKTGGDSESALQKVLRKYKARTTDVLVTGFDHVPIVVARSVGKGKVVLIGDAAFALNKNLEYVGGEPFDGRYDNADFWRWLITLLTDHDDWSPPSEQASSDDPSDAEESPANAEAPNHENSEEVAP